MSRRRVYGEFKRGGEVETEEEAKGRGRRRSRRGE
jgi:hypothetical protein